MTAIERITSKGQLVKLTFGQSDVAASQTAIAMNVLEVRDVAASADDVLAVPGYVIPWDFEIVAISILASTARTAGSIVVDATIDGTVSGLQATLDATNTTSHYLTQPRESDRGLAGSYVGVKLTTVAGWTPVTADVVVAVWVIAYLDGI
jgi:hypothetical protein